MGYDPYGNKKQSIAYFMRVTQFRNLFLPFKNVPSPVSPNPPGNNKISLGHIFFNQRHSFCNESSQFLLIHNENVKILIHQISQSLFFANKRNYLSILCTQNCFTTIISKLFGLLSIYLCWFRERIANPIFSSDFWLTIFLMISFFQLEITTKKKRRGWNSKTRWNWNFIAYEKSCRAIKR